MFLIEPANFFVHYRNYLPKKQHKSFSLYCWSGYQIYCPYNNKRRKQAFFLLPWLTICKKSFFLQSFFSQLLFAKFPVKEIGVAHVGLKSILLRESFDKLEHKSVSILRQKMSFGLHKLIIKKNLRYVNKVRYNYIKGM